MAAMAEEKKDSGGITEEKKFGEAAGEGLAETVGEGLTGNEEKELSDAAKPSPGAAFEGIYDRLPDISVKAVDRFILLCVIVLVAVVVIGVLRARHVI